MYRKILLAGTTAAVIVGAGGTALAVSGSDTTSGSPSTHAAQHGKHGRHGKHGKRGLAGLRRVAHGQFVVKGKDGKFVTHDVISGTVTAVSATSITVQAADKKSETFTVGKDTSVVQRTAVQKTATNKGQGRKAGKPAKSSIAKVAKGDRAFVTGTGTSTLTAKRVVDIKS